MLYWNACTKSLDRCYAQLKLIWPNQLPPMMSMSFLTMQHGQCALSIIQYLKPHQVQPFFWQDMLFEILFVADWHIIGGHRQSLPDHSNQRKNAWCIDSNYKVGDKEYYWWKKVSSAKQSPTTAKSHGLSQQFIQMELWGFNAEPEWKDLISGE